jgi:hypothetical protein
MKALYFKVIYILFLLYPNFFKHASDFREICERHFMDLLSFHIGPK